MGKDAEPDARPTAPERAEDCETWRSSWDVYFARTYPPYGNRPTPVYDEDGRIQTAESAEFLSRFIADEAEYRRQAIENRERFSRPSRVTIRGWEGRSPDQEIATLLDLRDYVRRELNQLRELGIGDHEPTNKRVALGDALQAYRNTWRAFDHLKVGNRPARLSSEPVYAEDVERELSNIYQWMMKVVADEQADLERFCERRPPLDLAAAVFVFAKGLVDALEREFNPTGEIGDPRDWREVSRIQGELRHRLTLIRENVENPPDWLKPVVEPIQRIAAVSDSIMSIMTDPDRGARGEHWHYQSELRQAASHLWRACQALAYPGPADAALDLEPPRDRKPESNQVLPPAPSRKPKRSTERGEGRCKLVSALTIHHKYADGSCLNLEPIGNNELANLAQVSGSTASAFFKEQFGGWPKYRARCSDAASLADDLKLLNGEFTPAELRQKLVDTAKAVRRQRDDE